MSLAILAVRGDREKDAELLVVCRRSGGVKHVEVKGTTTSGDEVILTPNEVRHAREHRPNALFILRDVILEQASDGSVKAVGGVADTHDSWHLDDGDLLPIGFRYRVRRSSNDA